jgi:hypothetical protein
MPNHPTTPLASGQLDGQTLLVQLVEPGKGQPPVIVVKWPEKPSTCPPRQFDQLVASAMRVLSNAVVELAALRVRKRL